VPTCRSLPGAVDRGLGPLVMRRSRLGRAVDRIARGAGRG
jgi:hypothetical protein